MVKKMQGHVLFTFDPSVSGGIKHAPECTGQKSAVNQRNKRQHKQTNTVFSFVPTCSRLRHLCTEGIEHVWVSITKGGGVIK